MTETRIAARFHDAHCNQGEYVGSCKYGEDDCPTLAAAGSTEKLNQEALRAAIRAECGDGCGWPTCGCNDDFRAHQQKIATRVVTAYLAAHPLSASLAERTRERDEALFTVLADAGLDDDLSDALATDTDNMLLRAELDAAEARVKALTGLLRQADDALGLVIGSLDFDREDTVSKEVIRRVNAARDALASSDAAPESNSAMAEIAAERRRQVEVEGWTPEHDDAHDKGQLALAAAGYAFMVGNIDDFRPTKTLPAWWPWDRNWWKPTTNRRDLIKAAALIVAEIERLDRAAPESKDASND